MNTLESVSKKYSQIFGIELTPIMLNIIIMDFNCELIQYFIKNKEFEAGSKLGESLNKVWIKEPKKQDDENYI